MAHLLRGYGDDRTPVAHSNDIFKEHLRKFQLSKLIGKKNSGMPVVVDDTLKGKAAGDTVVFHFIPQYKGPGLYGQNITITGNEKSLDEFIDTIKIDQVAMAFAKRGKLTTKRLIWDFRSEAKSQLSNWFTDQNNVWSFDALTGYLANGFDYIPEKDRATTPLVNGVGRCVRASSTNGYELVAPENTSDQKLLETLKATDLINTQLLDNLTIVAKHGNDKYQLAPVRMNSNGKEMYFLLLSLEAARDLRQDSRFEKHALSLVQAGLDPAKDPFVSGALGVWGNVILLESEYIHKIVKADKSVAVSRNLLLGANAMAMIWAQTTDYREEWKDYQREIGIAADEIRGQKKLVFNGVDQGVIQVPTAYK